MQDLLSFIEMNAAGALVFLPLHVVLIRGLRGRNLITSINAAICVSMIVALAVGWWLLDFSSDGARLMGCVAGGLTVAAYAGLYGLLLPSSVDRSVSVHIVSLLAQAPGHRMTEVQLFNLYTHDDMLQKRFLDCINTGIIKREGDMLELTPKGAKIAWLYTTVGERLGMHLWYFARHRTGASAFRR